jgi:hypothetical protein
MRSLLHDGELARALAHEAQRVAVDAKEPGDRLGLAGPVNGIGVCELVRIRPNGEVAPKAGSDRSGGGRGGARMIAFPAPRSAYLAHSGRKRSYPRYTRAEMLPDLDAHAGAQLYLWANTCSKVRIEVDQAIVRSLVHRRIESTEAPHRCSSSCLARASSSSR